MASNLQEPFELTLSNISNLYKVRYGEKSANCYNSASVTLGRVKKSFDWGGKRMEFPAPLSFTGGVGSGTIPEANTADYGSVQFTAKKMYGVAWYDRETIKAASTDKDAFFKGTSEVAQKTVESWTRNMSRTLWNGHASNGALGTIASSGVTDNGSGNYSLIISTATWKEANFEERDFVNIETGNTDKFEIQSVTTSTRTIVVQRQSGGSQVPADADVIFMQGSESNDPQAIPGVVKATSGTKYNITVGRRWQSYQYDAASGGITPDLINKVMLGVEKQCGKVPNLLVTSYLQFEKILNQLEDQKRYTVAARQQPSKGQILFEGVEFMSTMGPVGIFPERFCADSELYALNDNYIHIYHRPDFGWFDDDGTVFLRVSGQDVYEARYGGYLETFVSPPFHGVVHTLAT